MIDARSSKKKAQHVQNNRNEIEIEGDCCYLLLGIESKNVFILNVSLNVRGIVV